MFVRLGSQYLDSEGDLAHEFWEETTVAGRRGMIRTETSKLRPQGRVPYKVTQLEMENKLNQS